MPAASFHPIDRDLEALTPGAGVITATGREIEPYATHAGAAHRIEIALASPVVDNGHAASVCATRFHAEKAGRVVGSVHARSHNHHALDLPRTMHTAPIPSGDAHERGCTRH